MKALYAGWVVIYTSPAEYMVGASYARTRAKSIALFVEISGDTWRNATRLNGFAVVRARMIIAPED